MGKEQKRLSKTAQAESQEGSSFLADGHKAHNAKYNRKINFLLFKY